MSGTTKIQILSDALSYLGENPITSIDLSNRLVNALNSVYERELRTLLAENELRFAVKQIELSKLTTETPVINTYDYIYELPGDYIKLIYLYPHNIDYNIYDGNKIYTNADKLYMEYVSRIDESKFSDTFSLYFASKLAWRVAASTLQNAELAEEINAILQHNGSIAFSSDSFSVPTLGIQIKRWISSRWR